MQTDRHRISTQIDRQVSQTRQIDTSNQRQIFKADTRTNKTKETRPRPKRQDIDTDCQGRQTDKADEERAIKTGKRGSRYRVLSPAAPGNTANGFDHVSSSSN